jgi:glycosyltransferase involved in cell wall biosynthesis
MQTARPFSTSPTVINGKKVLVVMPAYNAELTLQKTYDEVMVHGVVDQVVVVDDCSRDATVEIAQKLPDAIVHVHAVNRGYGGNQKTCYKIALEQGADIIIMVHPDYQYTPKLIPAMASLIENGLINLYWVLEFSEGTR